MSKRIYVLKSFTGAHRSVIQTANAIATEYRRQGFDLTLRRS